MSSQRELADAVELYSKKVLGKEISIPRREYRSSNPNRNSYYTGFPLWKALTFFFLCASIIGIPLVIVLLLCGFFDW